MRHSAQGSRGLFQGRAALWLVLLVVVGAPMVLLLAITFNSGDPEALPPVQFGVSSVGRIFEHLDWIRNSLLFAVAVSVLSTTLGLGLAWVIARTDIRGKSWLSLLIILPYPMGAMVSVVAWSALGAENKGLINSALSLILGHEVTPINMYSVAGVIVVEALIQTPLAFLLIEAAARNMDSSLEESSIVLGAGRIRTARKVTLPLMLPSVVGSALFIFVATLGAFAVPSVLGRTSGFRVATQAVYLQFNSFTPNYPLAAGVGMLLVFISLVVVTASNQFLRRRSFAVVGGKARPLTPLPLGKWRPLAAALVYGYLAIAVVLPLAALVFASVQRNNRLSLTRSSFTLDNFKYVLFDYDPTKQSVLNSLGLGLATAIIGVALALWVALTVERNRRAGRGSRGLELMAMAPQAVPHLIFGLALVVLILVLPGGLYGTVFALLIAYVVIFLPLAYRGVAGVTSQIDDSLSDAARTLGAGQFRAARTIVIPLLRPSLVATGTLLFILCLTEVSASVMLSSTANRVLGPTMFNFYDSGGITLVSALALVQVVIVAIAVAIIRKLSGRWTAL